MTELSFLFRLLITVYSHGHTINYTVPHTYSSVGSSCQRAANRLYAHRKPGVRMTVECVPTDQRNI